MGEVVERTVDEAPRAEMMIDEAQRATILRAALASLPPSYRDVVTARAEATEPEVAARLGLSVANVKVRAHRARKQLRLALAALTPG